MKKIIAHLRANNLISYRFVSRPSFLRDRKYSDDSKTIANTRVAEGLSQYVAKLNILKQNSIVSNKVIGFPEYLQKALPLSGSSESGSWQPIGYKTIEVPACEIPDKLFYWEVNKDSLIEIQEDYDSFSQALRTLLDFIKKSQHQEQSHKSWGQNQRYKAFTKNARQRILEAGSVVDKDMGRQNSREVTLTLPGSTARACKAVSRWSGWIVNRQAQVLRRYQAKGIRLYWFFVWELQSRGALHQHWCVASDCEPWLLDEICLALKDKWYKCLLEIKEKSGEDCFKRKGSRKSWRFDSSVWQWNIKPIRKSVAAYFSKYASKNIKNQRKKDEKMASIDKNYKSKRNKKMFEISGYHCPSRWWGCSTTVKKAIKEINTVITIEVENEEQAAKVIQQIDEFVSEVANQVASYAWSFCVADSDSGFVYAQGYEQKNYYTPSSFDEVVPLFKRLYNSIREAKDRVSRLDSVLDF